MCKGVKMRKGSLRNTLCLYQEAVRQAGSKGLPMRLRLFTFLFLFLSAIMLGVLVVLFASGVFQGDLSENKALLQKELDHFSGGIDKEFGSIAVHTYNLAEELSVSLGRSLQRQGSSAQPLQDQPELLKQLLAEALSPLKGALERSDASGVFLLLDATVNPALPGADTSRACLYLKNMEPNIVNNTGANLRFVLGPISIARENGIAILPQWQMELDTGKLPYFREVMDTADDSPLPSSRLYRWSETITLPGSSERRMLCAAPIRGAGGVVIGVCGFEVSEMLFKLAHGPIGAEYQYLSTSLSPIAGDSLRLSGGLYAGVPPNVTGKNTDMRILQESGTFHSYEQSDGSAYAGLHKMVSLYPADSAFRAEKWAATLMLPAPVLDALISAQNQRLAMSLFLLMTVDLALAVFLSRRYIRPVAAALDQIRNPRAAVKTKIPEIDDLIAFLAAQDAAGAKTKAAAVPVAVEEHSALYREFIHNIALLSKAERRVFDLYIEGYSAQEIADILTVSINTVKTHNRRIYIKLNVTSYKELMVFIEMMKEATGGNARE